MKTVNNRRSRSSRARNARRQGHVGNNTGRSFSANLGAIVACSGVLLGFVALVGWMALSDNPVPIGQGTCEVVVVDFTDAPSEVQLSNLRTNMEERIKGVPSGACVIIGRIPGDQSAGPVVVEFEAIKPRDGRDADPLTENANLMRLTYEREFLVPLNEALDRVSKPYASKQSPLIEAFYELGKHPRLRDVGYFGFSYYGDGLQHMDALSHIRGQYDVTTLTGTVFQDDMDVFRVSDVNMYFVPSRLYGKSQPGAKRFWSKFWKNTRSYTPQSF